MWEFSTLCLCLLLSQVLPHFGAFQEERDRAQAIKLRTEGPMWSIEAEGEHFGSTICQWLWVLVEKVV